MSWQQLVQPNPAIEDYAGMCLRFAQSVFDAPARYESAWQAWQATTDKHTDRNIPNGVGVLVWFEHWGSYGNSGEYKNWGHVVVHMPDNRYLSSPVGKLGTYGQSWFDTIEQVERTFNAKYVGWTDNINGLKVAEYSGQPPTPPVIIGEDEDMKIYSVEGRSWLVGKGYCAKIHDHYVYTRLIQAFGQAIQLIDTDDWNRMTWPLGIPADVRGTLLADASLWACWDAERGYFNGSGA